MENIFGTLGDILRPETSKREFIIWERFAECTHAYRRLPGGIVAVGIVSAEKPSEALSEWLLDKCCAYEISRDKGTWYDDSTGRTVWEKGDTCADFGDYIVNVTDIEDIEPGSHLQQAAIKAHLIETEE